MYHSVLVRCASSKLRNCCFVLTSILRSVLRVQVHTHSSKRTRPYTVQCKYKHKYICATVQLRILCSKSISTYALTCKQSTTATLGMEGMCLPCFLCLSCVFSMSIHLRVDCIYPPPSYLHLTPPPLFSSVSA